MTPTLIPAAALLFALSASAQAQDTPLQNPVSAPGAPWAFWGFVVNAPDAPDLVSQFKALTGAALGRKLPEPNHSWAFTVAAEKIDKAVSSADELLAYMAERRGKKSDPLRFRVINLKEQTTAHRDYWCTRYTMLGEDLSVEGPNAAPVALAGLTCAHPDQPDFIVDVSYSEKSGASGISAELSESGEKFVSSLRFLPLPDRAEILDALKAAKAGKGVAALAMLKPLVDRQDTQAAMVAGEILLRGYGARKDPEAARRMFELAAKDGHPIALYSLGVIYETGTPRYVLEALKWFRLAADQRNNQAQLNLAILYDRGDGVPRDPVEAAKWGRYAANNGNPRAQQLLRGR
ncbi:MAG: tetratricopeptide repeat protein [Burkholderiales bacterium]|nr:tetratricopeptide repeat protein [Burkholderiales bacterium]